MRFLVAPLIGMLAMSTASATAKTIIEFAPWTESTPTVRVLYDIAPYADSVSELWTYNNPAGAGPPPPISLAGFGTVLSSDRYRTSFAPAGEIVFDLSSVYSKVSLHFADGSHRTLTPAQLSRGELLANGNQISTLVDGSVRYSTTGGPQLVGATFRRPIAAIAVPEPASWALMIGGLGVVGLALRRHARRTAAAIA